MALVLIAGAAASPFVEDSPCSKLTSGCGACINNSACGWCDGLPTNNDGSTAPSCLTLAEQNVTWHCKGEVASAGTKTQCDCDLAELNWDDATGVGLLNSKMINGVPVPVNTTYRGFSIAPTGKWPAIAGELAINFSNVEGTPGRAIITAGNLTVAGNATMYKSNGPNSKLCPATEILFQHDGGGNLSCSYKKDFQSGGASHILSMGCNINGSMPPLEDKYEYDMVRISVGPQMYPPHPSPTPSHPPPSLSSLDTSTFPRAARVQGSTNIVLWKCADPWHCDFKLPTPTPDPALEQKKETLQAFVERVLQRPQVQPARRGRSLLPTDPCSVHTTCDTCTKAAQGCQFCYGDLLVNGTRVGKNKNHCFSGNTSDNVQCGPNSDGTEAVTLKENCTVYKCNWASYRPPSKPDPAFKPNCTALNHSCGTPTTADDPCFYSGSALCAMFTDQNKCKAGCTDPTKSCNKTTGQCSYTNKCDPYATCECGDATVYQGLQINKGYDPGLWTVNLSISTVANNITHIKLIDPDGGSKSYNVFNWTTGGKDHADTAQMEIAGVPSSKAYLLLNRYGVGTFGQNFYMGFLTGGALSPDKIDWGDIMYTPGGQEFVFFACQHCVPHGTVAGGTFCAANANSSEGVAVSDRGNLLKGGCMIPIDTTAWLA